MGLVAPRTAHGVGDAAGVIEGQAFHRLERGFELRHWVFVSNAPKPVHDLGDRYRQSRCIQARPIETLTVADFDETFGINVRGSWLVMTHALPHLKATKGTLVNAGRALIKTLLRESAAPSSSSSSSMCRRPCVMASSVSCTVIAVDESDAEHVQA